MFWKNTGNDKGAWYSAYQTIKHMPAMVQCQDEETQADTHTSAELSYKNVVLLLR